MRTTNLLWSTWAVLATSIASLASPGQAAQVTLEWEAVTGASGYRIHYGQASRVYQGAVNAKSQTTYTVDGLVDGQKYYFSATAYDAADNESGYSNEVSATASSGASTATDLVAAYNFDEGSGPTVTDASGL